jgi:hypothetical protein
MGAGRLDHFRQQATEKNSRRTIMTRTRLIGGALLLLAAFLLGFVPQYRTAGGLRGELRSVQDEAASLRLKAHLAELRDLAGLIYLESNAKNYGIARQHSTQFFTRAAEVAAETSDESLKALLTEVSGDRDNVTAGLAEGRGGVQADIEKLARRLYENTMR